MKEYLPIKVKINHPWWHWFFTRLISYGSDGSFERHLCTKCERVFNFRAKQIEVVECDDESNETVGLK